MEVSGNKQMLLNEVEKGFVTEFDEFEKKSIGEFTAESKNAAERHRKDIDNVMKDIERRKKRAYSHTLAVERMNARKEYEQKREEIINRVFKIAGEKAEGELVKWEYLGPIKDFADNREISEMTGGLEEYKATFPLIGVDALLDGIVVRKEGKVYDFTYKTFVESKRLELRHKVSKLLFENDI